MRPSGMLPKTDGYTRAALARKEEREALYARDRGICQACGKPVHFDSFQVAHRIANTIANRKRWSPAVVDSPHNKAITHPGACNDAMNCGGNPGKCREIVRKALGGGD